MKNIFAVSSKSRGLVCGYVRNGGKETIESLLHPGATAEYSPTEMVMIRSRYPELVDF